MFYLCKKNLIGVFAVSVLFALFSSNAYANTPFITAVTGQYTLGTNLMARVNNCLLCHQAGPKSPATATLYGKTLRGINPAPVENVPDPAATPTARLLAAESLDSDGDGISNLAEIRADTDPSIVLIQPTVAMVLNNTAPSTGSFQTITRTMTPGNTAARKDIYWALRLPNGVLYVVQPDGSFNTAITSAQPNVLVTAETRQLMSYTFTGNEPAGQYIWYAGFADPGTLNFNNSIVSTTFIFDPTQPAVLNWGQGNWGAVNWQ